MSPLGFQCNVFNSEGFLHWVYDKINSDSIEVLKHLVVQGWGIWEGKNALLFNKREKHPKSQWIEFLLFKHNTCMQLIEPILTHLCCDLLCGVHRQKGD